jgi:large subunit ribosomal protein L29
MKASELRNLNKDDLTQKLQLLSQELLKLYYQKRIGSLDKPHLFRNVRREIAQVKTILQEKH